MLTGRKLAGGQRLDHAVSRPTQRKHSPRRTGTSGTGTWRRGVRSDSSLQGHRRGRGAMSTRCLPSAVSLHRCSSTKPSPTLCDPVDCSPPSSSVHGISQARILEWVAFPSPGHLPDTGIKPPSPALEGRFFTIEPPGKPVSPHKPLECSCHFRWKEGQRDIPKLCEFK